jgi:hypothetical protein
MAFAVSAAFAALGALIGIFGLPRVRPRSAGSRPVVAAEGA